MSRRLVLLRHGQTSWNVLGRLQGHTDIELDAAGHDQAIAAAPHVAAYAPAALWTSDLSRAAVTAAYVAKQIDISPRPDARFRELHLGEGTGELKADYALRHPQAYAALRAGDFARVPGAETLGELAERFASGLDDVLSDLADQETAVIVSHGTAIRAGLTRLLGWPESHAMGLSRLDNCCWTTVEEIEETGVFRLIDYNQGRQAPQVDPDFTSGGGFG